MSFLLSEISYLIMSRKDHVLIRIIKVSIYIFIWKIITDDKFVPLTKHPIVAYIKKGC